MKMLKIIFISLMCVLAKASTAQAVDVNELVKKEAEYILQCQFMEHNDSAYGALNNIFGKPTWVVPRENALALLGLVYAWGVLKDPLYIERAELAAEYLLKVQSEDGAWYNQYSYVTPGDPNNPQNTEALAKSPTQTAEVMLALNRLGYRPLRYEAMKRAAKYLISCQKQGGNGYLLGGGKDADGSYRFWRWASDNAFSYQALKVAQLWALTKRQVGFSKVCAQAAERIIKGINKWLYIRDSKSADYGVWHRVIDEKNIPVEPNHHDWINYAPQMLDLAAEGVNNPRVGEWIKRNLQQSDGACVWDDADFKTRKSPGYSFQAVLCWRDLQQQAYYENALDWAQESGLWQITADGNGAAGGWIDWVEENTQKANWWERFIDTSFYAITAYSTGYNFQVIPEEVEISYKKQERNK